MSEHVRIENRDDGVAVVRLGRGKVNAITPDVSRGIEGAFRELAGRADVRAIVLASERDGIFSAGFDLAEMAGKDRAWMEEHLRAYVAALDAVDGAGKPVVVAANGHAIAGGALLMLPCDYRVMAAGAKFGITEVDLGVPVPAQAVHLLARFTTAQVMRRLVLEARVVTSEEAHAFGIVDEVAPAGAVVEQAVRLATALAAKPAEALAITRQAIREATRPPAAAFEAGNRAFLDAWFSEEAQTRVKLQLDRLRSG